MYPSSELKILAERREYLQRRIGLRREECVAAAEDLRAGVERMLAWTHLARAGGIIGSMGASWFGFGQSGAEEDERPRRHGGKTSLVEKAVQWAPVAFRAFRLFSSFV
jgi:hypothetical protein